MATTDLNNQTGWLWSCRSVAASVFALCLLGSAVAAPDMSNPPESEEPKPSAMDICINLMAGFPDDGGLNSRHQFFLLLQHMAEGTDENTLKAFRHFGEDTLGKETNIVSVVEAIADTRLQQAVPEQVISHSARLINFAHTCDPYIQSQLESIESADDTLSHSAYKLQVVEDSLFLRESLSNSLESVNASSNELHGALILAYSNYSVKLRDRAELLAFDAELEEITLAAIQELEQKHDVLQKNIEEGTDKELINIGLTMAKDTRTMSTEKIEEEAASIMWRILNY